jgi:aryl-alcohol dehydrogenase-like predicted oxidoreductase
MLKLSKTSKLDGILSWSLQALDTCPGSIGDNGELVAACSGCYATTGNYRFSNVKAPRLENQEDWKASDWEERMINALESQRYFRWFDSGDMYSIGLAEKILSVMQQTPWVKHWLPTRMRKFAKFQAVLDKMQSLPNVMVRFSSDSVMGEYTSEHGSVIVPNPSQAKGFLCKAYEYEGRCNGCRACYDKAVPLVSYPAHGKKMSKVIKILSIKGA